MVTSYSPTKKQKLVKYLCLCGLIGLTALFQNTPGLLPEMGNARIFALLPVTIFAVTDEEPIPAAFLGLFSGILWDINSANHMGFNCIFLMLICWCVSVIVSHILRDTFVTNILLSSLVVFIYCFIYWIIFIVAVNIEGGAPTLITFYIPSAVYTILVSPLYWIITSFVKYEIKKIKIK